MTDVNGSPIVGAKVQMGSQSTTSTQFGAYALPIAAVQTPTVQTVTASATINGQNWSGQNTVQIQPNQATTSNAQIVLSNTATQGAITGVAQDSSGHPLPNARVFAAAPATATSFSTLSSFVAFTDQSGKFTIPRMPPLAGGAAYTVTASRAGYVNANTSAVVTTGQQTSVTLTLTASSAGSTLPTPQNLAAQSITTPTVPTRAAGAFTDHAFNAIRYLILARRGLLGHRAADSARITLRRRLTRNPPAGSLIENDVFWDYAPFNTLYGYDMLRSIGDATHFASIALLLDPLADRFADNDGILTPDTTYYYSLARLDTISYPANGTEGDPVEPPVSVEPLNAISLTAPPNGQSVTATPTLSWTGLSRAAAYQILVYAQFPSYQSDTDPNGVKPIWPQDITNPGSSLVTGASTTSQVYQGPALQSGHTYYWAVLAIDTTGTDFSISPIRSFTVQ
ncbi:MAG TPA: carboxypeptidase-like regulatory domain-containing protein [Chthonomonadaceae bacterium]|nr:carboxypeptidase-like regulatory domain-containing protein [Chthonomonadaceae bacterium]